MKASSSSIIPVIAESERVLNRAIAHFGLKVKPAQICLTVQSKGRRQALGWFAPLRWGSKKTAPGSETAVHEINLSAEYLREHNMGETLLHELAHAENQILGIRDCSGPRMHNRKFKEMAERLGLEVKPRDKSVGYGYTDLADIGRKFLESIKFDREVFESYRGSAEGKGAKPGSRLIKCECANCGYVCRTTRTWLDDVGPPHCPDHGEMGVEL